MSDIETNLQNILTKVYGKDVRQSIHDAIHDCYEDGKAGATDLVARERISEIVTESTGLLRGYSVQTSKITLSDLAQSGDKYNYTGGTAFSEDVKIIDVVAYSSGYGAGIPISYKYENKVLTATATVTFEFAAGIDATIVYLQSEPISLSELVDIRVGEDGTVYNTAGDAVRGQINELKSQIAQLEAIPYTVKLALDTILQNVGFKNNGVYTDELAVFHTWATDNKLISIVATFPQGVTVYDTDELEDLRNNLVVEANFEDETSVVVTDYALSGDLVVGTSVITVTYSGKTTTVSVTVTKRTSFVYVPTDGLLSEQSYISFSKKQQTANDPTESIIDGRYVVSTKGANWNISNFNFKPAQFTTAARLKVTFSISATAYLASSNTSSLGYIAFCVTDGTYSAAIGLPRYNGNSAKIRPRIITSSTPSWANSSFDFAVNTTHTAEIVVENNMQTIKLDDVDIITDQPLAEYSLAKPAKFFISNSNLANAPQTISIDRIEYYIDEGVE